MTRRCRLCSGRKHQVVFQAPPWKYYRCMECGLVFLHHHLQPSGVVAAYDDYLPADADKIAAWKRMTAPVVRESSRLVRQTIPGGCGRLLDIGSGFGFFLEAMRAAGWAVEGVEISPVGRKFAEKRFGVTVHGSALENLDLPEAGYDVVTCFYVIEHLMNPVAFLRQVHRLIKPGGMVLIRWPHTTPIVRLLGPLARKFDLYHTPYHLYDFSPRTMHRLMRESGFADIATTTGGHTRPTGAAGVVSLAASGLSYLIERITGSKRLLPGVSKTTVARVRKIG